MSVLKDPKLEVVDLDASADHEVHCGPTTDAQQCSFSSSTPNIKVEVKDDVEEDVWNAIEEESQDSATPTDNDQKCFAENRCDSVVTLAGLGPHDPASPDETGNFKCETCGCFRSTNQSLQRHMRTHTDERPFECPICGKPFRLNCTLQDHIPTHSTDRSFVCDLCDYTTKLRSAYSIHRKKHFDTVRKCKVCGKGFLTYKSYQKHVDEEHPSAVYRCDSCSFETTRRDKYSAHMKNKERGPCGQSNIACEHCQFRTSSVELLRQHMLSRKAKGNCFRGGLKPILKCAACEYTTLRGNDMQNHVNRRLSHGRCMVVRQRHGERHAQLLNYPGRETILVEDSVPDIPRKRTKESESKY